jgi:hypothetical protein
MAINIIDVTVISISAVGTNLITNAFSSDTKNTIRIVEIVGGLVTAQFAKKQVTKAIGVGVLTGALVNFVNGIFGICGTSYLVPHRNYQSTGYYSNAENINYCPTCNQR